MPKTIVLRDYQQSAVDSVRDSIRSGRRRPLLVLPTGGGKTVCFSHITAGAAAKGKRVMILVHRQELLKQSSRSLDDIGVPHGLIRSGRTADPTQAVQLASVQTLVRRLKQITPPDLVIVDEAHHATAGSWASVIAAYPQAIVLGVTATPCRLDGGNLGAVFDDLIIGPEVSKLMSQGFLCPVDYYAPKLVDTDGVHITAGDFNRKELSERTDKPTITGDAIAHYRKLCHGLPCVVFTSSVKHATHVCDQYLSAGYKARVLDGTMSDADRADAVASLADGRITHLVTVDIVSEGFDLPLVTVCQMLRATQSLGLYLQQVGRVLRPAPGKPKAIVLDHVGNVRRHGFAEDHREWSLEGSMRRKRSSPDSGPLHQQCPACYSMHRPAPVCPHCGTARDIKDRQPEQVDGTLEALKQSDIQLQARRQQGQAQSLGDLIALGKSRGMKNAFGWAQHVYRARLKK